MVCVPGLSMMEVRAGGVLLRLSPLLRSHCILTPTTSPGAFISSHTVSYTVFVWFGQSLLPLFHYLMSHSM